jgi:hypothetical protein
VSTSALICLGEPRTLSSVPSLGELRADASHERLGARKRVVARDPIALRTTTWTQPRCWNGFRHSAFLWASMLFSRRRRPPPFVGP